MLICTLAVLLLVIVAAMGYFQGAVRLAVSLMGLILGVMLAFPLAPTMNKLVALIGVKHPVWAWVWPPIFAFFIVYLVFFGISFFIHHRVYLHFKYRTDDTALYQWERMNRRLGACLGLIAGTVWFLLIGLVIHIAGYLSVQVASEEGSSSLLRYLSQAKQELRTTGLERTVAALDPMPPAYYQASDILGLLYQNPMITVNRLPQYPPFLTLGERTEFQEIGSDKDYINLLLTKADVSQIVSHPKTQALILNPEIVQELLQQDLKDLRQYLQSGISPKFEEEKILGVWNIDLYTTVAQVRKKHPNISASEMRQLRKKMGEELPGATLKATTDKKVTLKAPGVEAARQAAAAAAAAQAARQQIAGGAAPTMSPEMARRYGLGPSGNPRSTPPPSAAVSPPAANEPPPMVSAGQGSWQKLGDNYELRIQNDKGREIKVLAEAADGRLTIQVPPPIGMLVFVKAD